MTDSKIYSVLTHFDKIEQNRLRKYIRSPYFNVNETLMIFYDLLIEYIHTPNKSIEVTKEKIWLNLYPSESFNDVRFRKLSSDLLKLVEGFLAQQVYDENDLQQASFLLEAVGNKKIKKLYNSSIKNARFVSTEQQYKPAGYYYQQYLIEKNYYNISEGELRRSEKSNLEEVINNLDHFYLAEKIKWYCTVLSRKNLISHEYQLLFIDEIIEHLNKYHYKDIPPVLIYFNVLLTQTQIDEQKHYFNLKNLVNQFWQQFPLNEIEEIYSNLLNYCIKKLNQGNQIFVKEFVDVYKEFLNKNILPNSQLNPWHFKNAVLLALRLGEYEWTENFIKQYQNKLSIEFRENAVSYNLALVYFYQKKYNKVITLLQSVEYEDIAYNLGSKSMLVAVYYEMSEDESLNSLLESFKVYLSRHKEISDFQRKSYLNLIKYTKKLLKLIPGDIREIEKIKQEMEDDKKIGIASMKWIYEKLDELK